MPTTYGINANGNLTMRSVPEQGGHRRHLRYDQANRLTAASIDLVPVSQTSSYTYSGDGLRVAKTGVRYVCDVAAGLPVLLADYDGSGDLQRRYVWGPQGLAAGLQRLWVRGAGGVPQGPPRLHPRALRQHGGADDDLPDRRVRGADHQAGA